MPLILTSSKIKMLATINSIDNTLVFENENNLSITMNSIEFKNIAKKEKFVNNSNFAVFKGTVKESVIYLKFDVVKETQLILRSKHYTTPYSDPRHLSWHRTKDLPSNIHYDDNGFKSYIEYQQNGIPYRKTYKPIIINYGYSKKDNIQGCIEEVYKENSKKVHLFSIIRQKDTDKWVDGVLVVENKEISLIDLASIVPHISKLTYKQLLKIDKYLTKDEISLIEMTLL